MNNARSVLDEAMGVDLSTVDKALKNMMRRSTDLPETGKATLPQEAQLATANPARPELLANMSHEIRTPLNAMLGMLKLALQTELTAEQAEYLGLMQNAGNSLLSVVNNILDFSRIDAGQLEIENIPFSLQTCLDDTLRMLSIEARQKGLALVCHIDPEVPDALLGDPMRLRQIMVNLLGNAIKFTGHGDIGVHVALQAGNADELSCHFSVSDQGIGIPPEQQACIFSPYRQVDRSIARRYGGSGLGLSISAHLVAMMNGTIWLDSTPGQGSTFHFTACFGRQSTRAGSLPAAAGPLATAPGPATALRILLVDDNPTNRRLAQITLEKAGHHVLLADSGTAAHTLLQVEHPDLILMDLHMPDMDGAQTAAAIRCQERLQGGHIPIIAHTAHATPQDRARCRQAGIDDCLAKPVEPGTLLASVQHLGQWQPENTMPHRHPVVLDRKALFLLVHGDLHLLAEIRAIFLRDCGRLMTGLRRALGSHDAARFVQLAHTLRGMFNSLAANAAREAAGNLEELGIDDKRVALAYARLEHEVKALKLDLLGMMDEQESPRPGNAPLHSKTKFHQTCLALPSRKGKLRTIREGVSRLALRGAGQRFRSGVIKKGSQ